jgi:hypothetical protein
VFSRAQLLDAVWGYSHEGYEHTVTTHINRLRAKVEADPMNPRYILTVRGAGYKMRDAPTMTVRLRLALTILLTGLATALGVIVTVAWPSSASSTKAPGSAPTPSWPCGDACTTTCWTSTSASRRLCGLPAQPAAVRARQPALPAGADGTVLAQQRQGVAAAGLQGGAGAGAQAAEAAPRRQPRAAYVMGDDPEYMEHNAVVAARALRRAQIGPAGGGRLPVPGVPQAGPAGAAAGAVRQQPGRAGAGFGAGRGAC